MARGCCPSTTRFQRAVPLPMASPQGGSAMAASQSRYQAVSPFGPESKRGAAADALSPPLIRKSDLHREGDGARPRVYVEARGGGSVSVVELGNLKEEVYEENR